MNHDMKKASFLLATLAALSACGGGSNASSSGTGVTTISPLSSCFQLTNGNAFVSVSSPNINSYTDATGTSTSYYSRSSTSSTIASNIYNGKPVQAISSQTNATVLYPNASPTVINSVRDSLVSYDITSTQSTVLGGNETYTAIGQTPITSVFTRSGTTDLSVSIGQSTMVTTVQKTTSSNNSVVATDTTVDSLKFVGLEDVTTAAGTFKNVCKLTYTSTFNSDIAGAKPTSSIGTRWVASGFGIVKSTDTKKYADGRVPDTVIQTTEITSVSKGAF